MNLRKKQLSNFNFAEEKKKYNNVIGIVIGFAIVAFLKKALCCYKLLLTRPSHTHKLGSSLLIREVVCPKTGGVDQGDEGHLHSLSYEGCMDGL